MRRARIKTDGPGYYHCLSRIIERRRILGDTEKDKLLHLMRSLAAFGGLQVLAYAFISSHFHILLHVPARREVTDEELIDRLGHIYPKNEVRLIERELKQYREGKQDQAAEQFKARYTYRMFDLSQFFKAFKQRFSQYYNTRENRCGTLWEQRFKSIVVEGVREPLLTIAAYIELNPVRAGLVADPSAYRYCSYGAAVGGETSARQALCLLLQTIYGGNPMPWKKAQRLYRMQLFRKGQHKKLGPDGKPLRAGFTKEEVQKVIAQGGKLPLATALLCRVRYFTDGVALGSKEFVNQLFERYRDHFGAGRKSGACPMPFAHWPAGLCTLRNLRTDAISTA